MNPAFNKHFCDFKEVVQHFDPAYTYMVLDSHNHLGGKKTSVVIEKLLSTIPEETTEIQTCQYGSNGQYALIIKADDIDINATFNEFIVKNLQDQFNCCIYSAVS
jgi:hypothetical protein